MVLAAKVATNRIDLNIVQSKKGVFLNEHAL